MAATGVEDEGRSGSRCWRAEVTVEWGESRLSRLLGGGGWWSSGGGGWWKVTQIGRYWNVYAL